MFGKPRYRVATIAPYRRASSSVALPNAPSTFQPSIGYRNTVLPWAHADLRYSCTRRQYGVPPRDVPTVEGEDAVERTPVISRAAVLPRPDQRDDRAVEAVRLAVGK